MQLRLQAWEMPQGKGTLAEKSVVFAIQSSDVWVPDHFPGECV